MKIWRKAFETERIASAKTLLKTGTNLVMAIKTKKAGVNRTKRGR